MMNRIAGRFFDLLIFTSIFIAVCAVLMVWQTALLFQLQPPLSLYGFVFSGTVCSYNFHWYLSPPADHASSAKLYWSTKNKPIHFFLFIAGGIASFFFLWQLKVYWVWLSVSAFFTFLYSAPKLSFLGWLKKIAIAKTVYLAFAWMHVTVLLPLLIQYPQLSTGAILFTLNRFFFIYAICILFDYRDREQDSKENIRSMVTQLNEQGIDALFAGSVIVTLLTGLLLLTAISRIAVLILSIPVILLVLLYPSSKTNFSDYRYYFVLDGLMMASAPLVVLAKFAGIL
jgi:4-hydroxybenzoate polyprenyltransferase